jgi:hypothetical protein
MRAPRFRRRVAVVAVCILLATVVQGQDDERDNDGNDDEDEVVDSSAGWDSSDGAGGAGAGRTNNGAAVVQEQEDERDSDDSDEEDAGAGLFNYDAAQGKVLPLALSAAQKKQMLEQGYLVFKGAIPRKLVAEAAGAVKRTMPSLTVEEARRIVDNARPNAIDSAVLGSDAEEGVGTSVFWREVERGPPAAALARMRAGESLFARLLMQGKGLAIAKALYGEEHLGGHSEPHIAYRFTAAHWARRANAPYGTRERLQEARSMLHMHTDGGAWWHVDDISSDLGSHAFIMGHMLTHEGDVFTGNFGVHPGAHLLFAQYLREFHRQGGSVDAMAVARRANRARLKAERRVGDAPPGERDLSISFQPHAERFVAWLASTNRTMAPLKHLLVEPGDIVVAHHLLPHMPVPSFDHDPDARTSKDRICVFYRFEHALLEVDVKAELDGFSGDGDCMETGARWNSLTDAFAYGWTPLQAFRAGTKSQLPQDKLGECSGRSHFRDGYAPEEEEDGEAAAEPPTRPLIELGAELACTQQAECSGWRSPLLERGFFFCAATGRCERCEKLEYAPGRQPPAAAAGAKYAFNSVDGALPLMCPGLAPNFDITGYGEAFSKVIVAQQTRARKARHASVAYRWLESGLKDIFKRAQQEGLLQTSKRDLFEMFHGVGHHALLAVRARAGGGVDEVAMPGLELDQDALAALAYYLRPQPSFIDHRYAQ